MIVSGSIEDNRQKIIDAEGMDWGLASLIYRYHPVGRMLIDMPIDKAQARGREITINAPDVVVERFNTVAQKYNIDRLASNLLGTAKSYGAGAIIVGRYGEETESQLDLNALDDNTFINVVTPLAMGSTNTNNQMPNHRNFLQPPSLVRVQGITYHSSRCAYFYNPFEPSLYLNFNTSAFGYAPQSVYERVLYYLQLFLENDKALAAGNSKISAIIHKKAMQNVSTLDKANRGVMGMIYEKISGLLNGTVAIIGDQDSIETIDLGHFAEAMNATSELILDRIALASSDGMPASMLKSAMLGRGMSEGDNDKKKENECILKHQKALTEIYDFIDRILMFIAWNDADFYAQVQKQCPQYRSIKHNVALMQWVLSFSWKWNQIEEPTEQERIEAAEKKANISMQIITLMQQLQLDPDDMLELVMTHLENINDMDILPNKFMLDIQSIKLREIEQELIQFNNPQQITEQPQEQAA